MFFGQTRQARGQPPREIQEVQVGHVSRETP